jgi:hypothetical protein
MLLPGLLFYFKYRSSLYYLLDIRSYIYDTVRQPFDADRTMILTSFWQGEHHENISHLIQQKLRAECMDVQLSAYYEP